LIIVVAGSPYAQLRTYFLNNNDSSHDPEASQTPKYLKPKETFEFEIKAIGEELRNAVLVDGVEVIDIKMSELRTSGTGAFIIVGLLRQKLCIFNRMGRCECGDNELHIVSKVLSELGREDLHCPDATDLTGSIPVARTTPVYSNWQRECV
jgi:hypothetical protein